MDLVLKNLQRLICHKIQTNKQTIFYLYSKCLISRILLFFRAQLADAVEYPDFIHIECPGNGIKPFDSLAPLMLELWRMRSTPRCHCFHVHSGPKS